MIYIFIDPCQYDDFEGTSLLGIKEVLWTETEEYAINNNLLDMRRWESPYWPMLGMDD